MTKDMPIFVNSVDHGCVSAASHLSFAGVRVSRVRGFGFVGLLGKGLGLVRRLMLFSLECWRTIHC